mgnify:FL=1|jgi:hypothetical protein
MEKNHHALDTGGEVDVKVGSELVLEWFQAQPKWEIPVIQASRFTHLRWRKFPCESEH